MPGVTVQFHMLFEELVAFVADAMSRYSLAVELERFSPAATCTIVSPEGLTGGVARFGHVDRLWLLCKPPRARKYERFNLNVGRMKRGRLEQSHLGAGTDKAGALEVLNKVAQDLKKRTKAGVWVVGETGSVGYAKSFRVSPEAEKAARAGRLELSAIGFTQSFRVDAPVGRHE